MAEFQALEVQEGRRGKAEASFPSESCSRGRSWGPHGTGTDCTESCGAGCGERAQVELRSSRATSCWIPASLFNLLEHGGFQTSGWRHNQVLGVQLTPSEGTPDLRTWHSAGVLAQPMTIGNEALQLAELPL